MNIYKCFLFVIPVLFFSCSSNNNTQQNSASKFPEISKTAVHSVMVSSVDSSDSEKRPPKKKHGSRAFDKYDISFWDSVKTRESKPSMPRMSALPPSERKKDFNVMKKSELVYKFGASFVDDSLQRKESLRQDLTKRLFPLGLPFETDSLSLETEFLKIITEAENKNQDGLAAIMVSGYFFEQLLQLSEIEDIPENNILALGVSKLDSLKSYCNSALLSEPDINMTLPIQRITMYIDTVKNAYKESLASTGDNRYLKFREKIQQMESKIFEDNK